MEALPPDDEPELPDAPDESGVLDVLGVLDEPDVPEVPDVSAAPEPDDAAPLLPEVSAGFCFAAFAPCFLACLCLCCGFLVSMPLSELLVPVVA